MLTGNMKVPQVTFSWLYYGGEQKYQERDRKRTQLLEHVGLKHKMGVGRLLEKNVQLRGGFDFYCCCYIYDGKDFYTQRHSHVDVHHSMVYDKNLNIQ